jgi:hypothetical protein
MYSRRILYAILVFALPAAVAVTDSQPSRPQESPSRRPAPAAAPSMQDPLPQNANQYIRQNVEHELAERNRDHSYWRYSLHREDDKGSQDRDVIQTGEGSLSRTLLKFDRPLTADERNQDEARMLRQMSDPVERARHAKREKEDRDLAKSVLKAMPDAFIFQYDGEEDGLVRLTFAPNPQYSAPNHELQVLHSLRGKMWIDRAGKRLARVDASLFEDATFGLGVVARLNKGGTFTAVQRQVAPEHWETVTLDIDMSGHAAIFKTIKIRRHQLFSDFQRVSDSLTLHQAYEMLQNRKSVSTNKDTSGRPQGRD